MDVAIIHARWEIIDIFLMSEDNLEDGMEHIKKIQYRLNTIDDENKTAIQKKYESLLLAAESLSLYESLKGKSAIDPAIEGLLDSCYEQYQSTTGSLFQKIEACGNNTTNNWGLHLEPIKLALVDAQQKMNETKSLSSVSQILLALPPQSPATAEVKVSLTNNALMEEKKLTSPTPTPTLDPIKDPSLTNTAF